MKTKTLSRQRRQRLHGHREWELLSSLLPASKKHRDWRSTHSAHKDKQAKASLLYAVFEMHVDGSSPAPMSCGSLRFLPLTAGLTAAADIL